MHDYSKEFLSLGAKPFTRTPAPDRSSFFCCTQLRHYYYFVCKTQFLVWMWESTRTRTWILNSTSKLTRLDVMVIYRHLLSLSLEGQAWCSGESCLTESPGRGFEAASPQILRGEGLPRFFPSLDPTHVGASGTGSALFFVKPISCSHLLYQQMAANSFIRLA